VHREALLRNAVEIACSCTHPALPRLLNVIESPAGPALVFEAAAGELVHVPADEREDPASSYQRFAHLPAERLLGVFDVLIDLHVVLAGAGWVAVDLYDDMGRMFGASRFMAPEEFELGAVIDERTTVFTLGRLVWHFGTRLTVTPRGAGRRACAAPVRRPRGRRAP
jgi:serine/threonine-protein kinase